MPYGPVAWHELWIFLAATATSGVGSSLLFLGGMALINGAVATERRGGVLSAAYLFAYLSLGIVALLLGVVATQRGSVLQSTSEPVSSSCSALPPSACSPRSGAAIAR
jgi:hypothetical protein